MNLVAMRYRSGPEPYLYIVNLQSLMDENGQQIDSSKESLDKIFKEDEDASFNGKMDFKKPNFIYGVSKNDWFEFNHNSYLDSLDPFDERVREALTFIFEDLR